MLLECSSSSPDSKCSQYVDEIENGPLGIRHAGSQQFTQADGQSIDGIRLQSSDMICLVLVRRNIQPLCDGNVLASQGSEAPAICSAAITCDNRSEAAPGQLGPPFFIGCEGNGSVGLGDTLGRKLL